MADSLSRLTLRKTALEIQKTSLEVERLNRETQLQQSDVVLLISLVTTVLAVAAAIAGVFRYLSQRRDESRARLEQRIATYQQDVVAFPTNRKATSSQLRLALQELALLLKDDVERQASLGRLILEAVTEDCDFSETRHVGLDVIALKEWQAYGLILQRDAPSHDLLLYKYARALDWLYAQAPDYFTRMGYDREKGIIAVKEFTDESRFRHFQSLLQGYRLHLELLRYDAARYHKGIERFATALNNGALATALFSRSVDAPVELAPTDATP